MKRNCADKPSQESFACINVNTFSYHAATQSYTNTDISGNIPEQKRGCIKVIS